MKKIFQNIVDRLHLIYVALTKRHFICAYYNRVDGTSSTGAGYVETLPSDMNERKLFVETVNEFNKTMLN